MGKELFNSVLTNAFAEAYSIFDYQMLCDDKQFSHLQLVVITQYAVRKKFACSKLLSGALQIVDGPGSSKSFQLKFENTAPENEQGMQVHTSHRTSGCISQPLQYQCLQQLHNSMVAGSFVFKRRS